MMAKLNTSMFSVKIKMESKFKAFTFPSWDPMI